MVGASRSSKKSKQHPRLLPTPLELLRRLFFSKSLTCPSPHLIRPPDESPAAAAQTARFPWALLRGLRQAGGPPYRIFSPSQLLLPPPSPSALSSCLLSCSFQRLAEPATGSPGLVSLLTLFQTASVKVSMTAEKANPTSSPHWLGRRKGGAGVYACVCKEVRAYLCNAVCGPRTKRIPSTSLQPPTLRLQTPSKVHVRGPESGLWGSGDGGAYTAPPP